MTHVMEVPFKAVVIQEEAERVCSVCKKLEELRPYGRNGANVCFSCMMGEEDEGIKQFTKLLKKGSYNVHNSTNLQR